MLFLIAKIEKSTFNYKKNQKKVKKILNDVKIWLKNIEK